MPRGPHNLPPPSGVSTAITLVVEDHSGTVLGLDEAAEVHRVRVVDAPARVVCTPEPSGDPAGAGALREKEVLLFGAARTGQLHVPCLWISEPDRVEGFELHLSGP